MPIIKVANGYIYKKNTKKTGKKAVFILAVFLSSLMIGALTLYVFANFDVTSAFKLNKYQIFESRTYFAISVESGDSFSDVAQEIDYIRLQGGAGFVLEKNRKYHLIVATYKSEEEALKVLENMTDYDAHILEINLPKLIISADYSAQEISALKQSLNLVNIVFENLFNLSICLDRGEMLDAEVKQKLKYFTESCQETKQNLSNMFSNNLDNIVTRAKIFQSEVISSLTSLSNSTNLSSDIRYAIINTISSFASLQKNVMG